MTEVSGLVSHIQRFSTGDGPGIRTTVFMQGCDLRCGWCHNPEAVPFKPVLLYYERLCVNCGLCVKKCPRGARAVRRGEHDPRAGTCAVCGNCVSVCPHNALSVSGIAMTAGEVAAAVREDADFYEPDGGVTLSGGEPLCDAGFAAAVAELCHNEKIGVAVDTAACAEFSAFERILPYTDLFLIDLKCATEADYREHAGGSLERVLDNISRLIKLDRRVCVRIPVIPGINDAPGYFAPVARRLLQTGASELTLLPFHRLGAAKYSAMGLAYEYGNSALSEGAVGALKNEFTEYGFNVTIEGGHV